MTAKVNEYQIRFADLHFKNLRLGIIKELCGVETIEDVEEFKKEFGLPLMKFLTTDGSFKLTANYCSNIKKQLEGVYIHRPINQKEYNQILDMLRNALSEAVNQKASLEFIE
jgi:hypothetical protein